MRQGRDSGGFGGAQMYSRGPVQRSLWILLWPCCRLLICSCSAHCSLSGEPIEPVTAVDLTMTTATREDMQAWQLPCHVTPLLGHNDYK